MKNILLSTLVALTLLCTGASAQNRPAPTGSPYTGAAPIANPPTCGFGYTPDAACLASAEAAYDSAADTAMKSADNQWNAAVAVYNATMQAISADLTAMIAGCAGVQSCIDNAQTAAATATIAAVDVFRATEDAIWATLGGDIQAAKLAYDAATQVCCVLLDSVDPAQNPPQLGICDIPLAAFTLKCADGTFPDGAKVMACHATYNAEMAALCANLNNQMAVAYATLISGLQAAQATMIADGAMCADDPCVEAALAAYNESFNSLWEDYHNMYADLSDLAAVRGSALFADVIDCIQRACP